MFSADTLLDWIVVTMGLGLLAIIMSAWLLSYRDPRSAPVGPGQRIFSLPAWAQIGGGLAITALLAYVSSVLWIPLPLAVLGALWTLGAMSGVSTSFAVQLTERHRLIQRGPYALVRHPMYLGY